MAKRRKVKIEGHCVTKITCCDTAAKMLSKLLTLTTHKNVKVE